MSTVLVSMVWLGMAGHEFSPIAQFNPSQQLFPTRSVRSSFVGQTHNSGLTLAVCHNRTYCLDCEHGRLFCSQKLVTTFSCFRAASKRVNARQASSSRVIIRASSLKGRFPQTPVHLPANPPTWLRVAREQMRSAGKVEEFRKRVQLECDNRRGQSLSFPLKNLKEKMKRRELIMTKREHEPWLLMELSIHCTYSEAYELEAEGLGFCPTGIKSVFSVPDGHEIPGLAELWSFQSGLRFVMEPLVVAEGPEELIASITNLQLKENLQHFCLSHEKLAPSANRTGRKELRAEVGVAIGGVRSCRYSNDRVVDKPRFAIIEISTGYIFGHVIYAPGPQVPNYGFAPHRWSAGIPAVLASIAVNIAGSAGDKLVDPCCGLGTILFEANRRGLQAEGSDISLGTLVNAAKNFDHFKLPYTRAWGDFCSIFGPHKPRSKASCPSPASPWPPPGTSLADPEDTELVSATLEQVEASVGAEDGRSTGVFSGTISLAIRDARSVDFEEADCVVTNFPFGRFLTLEEGCIHSILVNLKGRARNYVFFFGTPLSPSLTNAGYHVLREVSVCTHNKRFMAICKCLESGEL